uniref:microtubule-associated tumor suppressor 1 homolog A-like n=1 Tax=Monopterus albus TaxID=43700 RepID=UPI0009B49459|nr:microtubule-associated tumor suppressor 1 homolog A-like [Monopterus albus]
MEKDALQRELETERLTHADRVEQGQQLIDTLKMEKVALQHELENEKLTHADMAEQGQQLIDTLRTENDSLRKEMAEEVLRMQKEADHKALLYQRKLQQLRDQLKLQTSLTLQLSTLLKAKKLSSREQPEPEQCEDQEPLPSALHDEELTKNAVVSEKTMTETTKQKSRWKRFRHFLGLRKPQK